MHLLIFLYFLLNAYSIGRVDFRLNQKKEWFYLFIWIIAGAPIMGSIWLWDKIQTSDWFHDLKFWWQINFTSRYANLNRASRRTSEKFAQSPKAHPRVKRQWARIKSKYDY